MTSKPQPTNLRRVIGLLILLVSLCLLLWGMWPIQDTQRTLPVAPEDMSLPEGSGSLPPAPDPTRSVWGWRVEAFEPGGDAL